MASYSSPATAHLIVTLAACDSENLNRLALIPGVHVRHDGSLTVAHHAVLTLKNVLQIEGLTPTSFRWIGEAPKITPWDTVVFTLKKLGEVRDFVLDSFLLPYQKEALSFGFNRSGVHLFHSTGAGKTCTAMLWSLLQGGDIVVVTRSGAKFQHAKEWERFTHIEPFIIRPQSELRKKHKTIDTYLAQKGRKVYIVGWESLPTNISFLEKVKAGTVIFDELHTGKSSKRFESIPVAELPQDPISAVAVAKEQEKEARSRGGFVVDGDTGRIMIIPLDNIAMAASRLSKSAKRRIGTTATPVKDRVRDLWAQLDLIEPYSWGASACWLNRYADRKPGKYGGYDTSGKSNTEELSARLKHVAHIVPYSVTHRCLPPKRRQSIYVAPSDQVPPSPHYGSELKKAQAKGAGAVLEVKLAESASRKRQAVLGHIEDLISSGAKVCVFTGRRRDVDELGDLVKKLQVTKSKSATIWAAHGETSPEDRAGIVVDYMAHPGPCVLIGTGDSFGESLNLHDTDCALFVMLPYTPGQLRQWEGRFCRQGQKRPVVINYVIAENSVDEHVSDILIRKLPAVEQLVKDEELMAAKDALAGWDGNQTLDQFADSILAKISKSSAASSIVDAIDLDLRLNWEEDD